MRAIALLLVLALPAAADAQRQRGGSRADRSTTTPRPEQPIQTPPRPAHPIQPPHHVQAEPTPRIGSPLVPAGWQWFGNSRRGFSIGDPYMPAGQQWFGEPGDGRRRPGNGGLYPGPWFPYGYGGGVYYGDGYYPAEQEEASRFASVPPPPPAIGLLRLEITPSTGLEYFSDGVRIGTSSELGTEFEINAGARRIEIRAAGYRPLIVDTRINEGQITTFRGALERLQDDEPMPRATGSKTLYIIRGCYIGNKMPEAADLPKGCDIKQMTTR